MAQLKDTFIDGILKVVDIKSENYTIFPSTSNNAA